MDHGRLRVFCQSVRWNSGSAASQSGIVTAAPATGLSSLPPGYIPEPPVPPVSTGTEEVIQQLTALGEPTLRSLGLGSWYPNGLVQSGLEALHVGLDVPWWTTIVIGTVIVRLALFPLVILAQRNAALMHNHMPIVQKLQDKFSKARQSGNPLEAARTGAQLMDYMKTHKVNPMKNMLVPFAQLPIFISVFVGIRQMANLPVDSMKVGGIAWFTDLTIPDPYYALPFITMATFFATLELGVDGVRASSMTNTMRFIMRAMPFVVFPLILNFPSGMLCYWLTSNLFSLMQVLFLKINSIRLFFKIPDLVVHDVSIRQQMRKPFLKSIKESYKNSKTAVDMEALQRVEAVKFKEAGLGAVQKTYSYDPTKGGTKATAKPE